MSNAKTCSKCNETKVLEDFDINDCGKQGRTSSCKACISVSRKEYYQKNRQKKMQNQRNYRKRNPGYNKNYYEKNKAKILEYQKEYYILNKDQINENKKISQKKLREERAISGKS